MLRSLFELLFWASADGLWHVAARAWRRNATPSQQSPYNWRNRFDDPVYKKNLQRLIERNRQFEDERNRKFETKQ
jgi:hypothetical protein